MVSIGLNLIIFRNTEENIKSAKHTQLPVVPADCQIEATQQHTRTVTVPSCGVSTPMINNCTSVNTDSRHRQLISDQEPPDGDETDPDVIPNQYGKFAFYIQKLHRKVLPHLSYIVFDS